MRSPTHSVSFADKVNQSPESPGVYLLKDRSGRVIYVGKARSLRDRLRSYTQSQTEPRHKAWVGRVADVETIVTRSETEALVLEENLIKIKRPRYNVRLRDDKKFPYLKVTVQERFPRIFPTRRLRPDGAMLFGPYTSAKDLRRALRGVKRIFRLRTCHRDLPEERPARPCLNFALNRCSGPCQGESDEREYRQQVEDVIDFLSGRSDTLTAELEARMTAEAQARRFERAAVLRDQLLALRELRKRQQAVTGDSASRDVIGLARGERVALAAMFRVREGKIVAREEYPLTAARDVPDGEVLVGVLRSVHLHIHDLPDELILPTPVEEAEAFEALLSERRGRRVRLVVPARGEKVRLLDLAVRNAEKSLVELAPEERVPRGNRELAEVLGLQVVPRVIEGVDISNTQGRQAVGSVVVFHDGRPVKSEYRLFKVRTVAGPDDFAMIEEVLSRRLRGQLDRGKPFPDLVLVDGGKGQLSAALSVYRQFDADLPVLGLAKRTDTVFYMDGRELSIPASSPALKLLKRIRDESHRFAVALHRKLRGKRQIESELDALIGIGPVRKAALIRHFGSLARLRLASVDEVVRVRGFGPALAEKLLRQLRH